jgi:hypothetical protein
MRLTVQQLARAVATAIEDEVLPTLDARTWPASRLRSSLGLLQLIIDQAQHETDMLIATSSMMRSFLLSVACGALAVPPGSIDRGKLEADVNRVPETVAAADLAQLSKANNQLRELLSETIRAVHANRPASSAADPAFQAALHELLFELAGREDRILAEAAHLLPM